jgi:nucleoside-diphosphate-sugar epimerase
MDDSAFRRALGWQPPVPFAEAIRLTAQWYRLECRP